MYNKKTPRTSNKLQHQKYGKFKPFRKLRFLDIGLTNQKDILVIIISQSNEYFLLFAAI